MKTSYAARAKREDEFFAAMKRGGFKLTHMGGGALAWMRTQNGLEAVALSPRGDGSAPLTRLSAPVVLHVAAPDLTEHNEDLITLRFPSVSAMLAALPRAR